MRLRATGTNIHVRKMDSKESTVNGIIISPKNESFSKAQVLSVGEKVSPEISVGYILLIPAFSGMKCMTDELGDHFLLDEKNILAIVVEE